MQTRGKGEGLFRSQSQLTAATAGAGAPRKLSGPLVLCLGIVLLRRSARRAASVMCAQLSSACQKNEQVTKAPRSKRLRARCATHNARSLQWCQIVTARQGDSHTRACAQEGHRLGARISALSTARCGPRVACGVVCAPRDLHNALCAPLPTCAASTSPRVACAPTLLPPHSRRRTSPRRDLSPPEAAAQHARSSTRSARARTNDDVSRPHHLGVPAPGRRVPRDQPGDAQAGAALPRRRVGLLVSSSC